MIKQLILINSANFNFLNINLEKDLFFLGDNGSGKTTVIRAIHYLYSGDVRNLGIPTDKDGFKEYYFKYSDSYIIYVFEDFFIFMYKTSSEIVKIFSKQNFDLTSIINENSNLKELKEIKQYVKSPNLKKTVKSLSEYRDIIYGNNTDYLDFKFTSIKNNDSFIGLFNEIFNIDKSIIDSKSIKKAIQTTLGYETKVMEFDHEYYLQNIYKYQAKYKFFKEFEKQKKNIDGAYNLKNELLEYEKQLLGLLGKIKYRFEEEKKILDASKEKKEIFDSKLKSKNRRLGKRKVLLKRCTEVFEAYFRELKLDIAEIERLKEKFSDDRLLENRDWADRYTSIEESYIESKLAYEKLKSGFENELNSIEDEIKSLEYKKDKELRRELENKKDNKRKHLQSLQNESVEKLELALLGKKQNAKRESKDLREEIKNFSENIEEYKEKIHKLESDYRSKVTDLRKINDDNIVDLKKKISTSLDVVDTKNRKLKSLKFDRDDLVQQKVSIQKDLAMEYKKHKDELESRLKEYVSMLEVKEGSFKEFLSEEVDSWERELYPILDSRLLDMTELNPRLKNVENLFAIELDKTSLKSIPTKEEATQKIEALTLELENLKLSYEGSLSDVDSKFEAKREVIVESIELVNTEIDALKAQIEELEKTIISLVEKLKEQEAIFVIAHRTKEKELNDEITTYRNEIVDSEEYIEGLHQNLRDEDRRLKRDIEILDEEFRDTLNNAYKMLQEWKDSEVQKIIFAIKSLESKKQTVSKDDRLFELEEKVKASQKEQENALKAKSFLEEYAHTKEKLASLLSLESKLENKQKKFKSFEKNLEYKIDDYEADMYRLQNEKDALLEKNKHLNKGINSFQKLTLDLDETIASHCVEFLLDLVVAYESKTREYANAKVDLKTLLNKINRLRNTQNDIDISFNLDEYDEMSILSENVTLLSKIDEIYEYKNKKLEIVKKSIHKKFISFITELPTKMSLFNDSEDKFMSQVVKINKNLSGIDFGVINSIRLNTKIGDKKSIAKLLIDLNKNISTISSLLNETSLFYEKSSVLKELENLEAKFKEIKLELKGSSISLTDTIDLTLSFRENAKLIKDVSQLKNESSTGGSMLLKMAIAISILQIFVEDESTPFFLIVDEVSRLHSDNQEKLRKFANSKGFSIIFVTPEPTYSKPDSIKYYRFKKSTSGEFEGIELNR